MIDELPVYTPPSPNKPRLGPGAPPLPPSKRRDEAWKAFDLRLWAYQQNLRDWEPSRGWLESDRANFNTQAEEMRTWVQKQKDVTP